MPRRRHRQGLSRCHPLYGEADHPHGARTALTNCPGLVREAGLKVVLTGEGADEVFAGYDIFRKRASAASAAGSPARASGRTSSASSTLSARFAAAVGRVPRRLFRRRRRCPSTTRSFRIGHASRARRQPDVLLSDLRAELKGYDAAEELVSRLPPPLAAGIRCIRPNISKAASCCPDIFSRARATAWRWRMGSRAVSRSSTTALVEFAAKLPPDMKLRGLVEKHILREATKDLLPPAIGRRTKQPYRAPDSHSFSGAGELDYVRSAMSGTRVAAGGLFNAKAVTKPLREMPVAPRSGFRDNAAFVGVL